MSNLWIDCEFNSGGGDLISLALVNEDGSREFYEVVECKQPIDPWVAEHVMPFLEKEALSHDEFQARLQKFLKQFPGISVYANHPADFKYFMQAVEFTQGKWMMIQPLTMILDDDISGKGSKVPHNALHDARASRDSWMKNNGYL
jgi:hypothetical protein